MHRALRHLAWPLAAIFLLSCQNNAPAPPPAAAGPSKLSEVPAVSLNYRYEADVPPPEAAAEQPAEQLNAAIQADFDQNRPEEVLDKTVTSPDQKRILAVYHYVGDAPAEFRLDMYTADGKLLKRVTSDAMAVHFPDTIRWSPDSQNAAFAAMLRTPTAADAAVPPAAVSSAPANTAAPAEPANTGDATANADAAPPASPDMPQAPTGILTFRTEQIYLCGVDGDGVKPITQTEGLIYFFYVWSPDSSALAALAVTVREWQYLNQQAEKNGEIFAPLGRARIVEKNGRERRLDDALTAVQPVWSPDSSKVALAFGTQIRIYDAVGTNPTQAAVPLRNQLLISSQAFDRQQQEKLASGADVNANGTPAAANNANASLTPPPADQAQNSATLPDEHSLVSFNPIVSLRWPSDDLLYFETAFVKRMKNEADSVTSFPRWHRLVLSPQPSAVK